ncbi:hypothetical protein [Rhodoblastus sp.]|uniref:hypothetical protein n=1 Tax=Rhodoblastus sp. TaxID=1962975 RepID=UPI003F9DFC5D
MRTAAVPAAAVPASAVIRRLRRPKGQGANRNRGNNSRNARLSHLTLLIGFLF